MRHGCSERWCWKGLTGSRRFLLTTYYKWRTPVGLQGLEERPMSTRMTLPRVNVLILMLAGFRVSPPTENSYCQNGSTDDELPPTGFRSGNDHC